MTINLYISKFPLTIFRHHFCLDDNRHRSQYYLKSPLNQQHQLFELIPKIDVIDLTVFLNNVDFYDGLHPNKNGAEKLSKEISKYIN